MIVFCLNQKPNIMKKLYKWREKVLASIENMSNEELLEETIALGGGDDYDIGCYTPMGEVEFECLLAELRKRLKDSGFLGE